MYTFYIYVNSGVYVYVYEYEYEYEYVCQVLGKQSSFIAFPLYLLRPVHSSINLTHTASLASWLALDSHLYLLRTSRPPHPPRIYPDFTPVLLLDWQVF